MNKLFVTVIISLCICSNTSAKKDKLYLVSVPDSIAFVLDEAYKALTKRANVNAGVNVHNVINYKNNKFENGLYSFGGMGPHFPKLLFIYYNSTLYIISARMIQDIWGLFRVTCITTCERTLKA